MTTIDWQKVWRRQYVNKPDQMWKIKSLNAQNAQNYNIKLPSAPPPSPKINKVNATMFCITIDTDINLFFQQSEQKRKKTNKVFSKTTKTLAQNAEVVTGITTEDGENYIVVGSKDKLTLFKIVSDNGEYRIEDVAGGTKSLPDFKALVCFGTNRIVAISAGQLTQFEVSGGTLKELVTKKIQFEVKGQEEGFRALKPIGIVLGAGQNFYYFGSRVQKMVDESKLKAGATQKQTKTDCEAITIVEMHVEIASDITSVKGKCYQIDHIFQLGLFSRTKIYEIQKETFLFSLHEEIILIKKHFTGFIVWDNVSVVSSRNQSMKGQLSLTSQPIMVFSENGQISAHEIFFDEVGKKLSMPPIDSYRGHEVDQVLFDSFMLDTANSIMKVLLYVKPGEVVYPGGGYSGNDSNGKKKEEATSLDFAIQCINQNQPVNKLQQMILKQKPNKEIQQFCKRYNIDQQKLLKSKWNVSNKELKQIQTILMSIKDDQFIQNELNSILKKDSHNLQFLDNVEKKQGNRLKLLLAEKITEYARLKDPHERKELKKYIFDVLQWLMESDMFRKKITYSKNFLVFKEYDFIEIGKLRAASLKQQIKLLSCKSFEKRLKYFLNEFQTLVIANFDEVFEFLLIDKNVDQIEKFIKSFSFILPQFNELSDVYILRKDYNIIKAPQESKGRELKVRQVSADKKKKDRLMSFNLTGNQTDQIMGVVAKVNKAELPKESKFLKDKSMLIDVHQGDKCYLWQNLKEGDQILQTIESFIQKHINQLRGNKSQSSDDVEEAVNHLRIIIAEFQQSKWFKTAAFKQHCMITKTSSQIYKEYKELKRKKVFKILIKFLYKETERLEEEDFRLSTAVNKRDKAIQYQIKVDKMIENFITDGLIPQSFKRNVDGRVKVYRDLLLPLTRRKPDKKTIAVTLPPLSQFVVTGEPQYFTEIFSLIRDKILTEVKDIYDSIEPSFFRQRFQLYLKSQEVTAKEIISFLDEFNQNVQADDIRIEVFSAIKRLLTLTDETNTRPYIQKSLQKEVLPQREDSQNKLREQAKIPIGFYFVDLFKKFKINYTYEQLIGFTNQTQISKNDFIQQLVRKYCACEYEVTGAYEADQLTCKIQFQQVGVNDKLPDTQIHEEPLQFFGLLLILLDMLDFFTQEKQVYELMMENYLCQGKFRQLSQFVMQLKNYHINEFNMNTKNYQMISDFKEWIDIDGSFIDYTLGWIKKNYDSIKGLAELDNKVQLNDRAINMLEAFNKHSPHVKKERALFDILHHLMKFQARVVLNVQDIKDEAAAHSSFMFMMHMLKKVGVEKLSVKGGWDEQQKVECLFRIFQSHQEHIFCQKVDYYHPEFIRFLIQVCIRMIASNDFPMAKYLILYKIPNDNEYFKDVMMLFLAAADRKNRNPNYSNDISKMILSPQTTSLIRNNLETIIDSHNIKGFIPLKPDGQQLTVTERSGIRADRGSKIDGAQSKYIVDDRPQEKLQFYSAVCDIFKLMLGRHWTYDAFFFLARAKIVRNDSLRNSAKGFFVSYTGGYDQQVLNTRYHACFLITSYCKTLEQFIEKQFYPTFAFFFGKIQLLQDTKERKDVIKDINIALSKLEKMCSKSEKNKKLFDMKNQLESYYEAYMAAIGEEADIKLVDAEGTGNTATVRTQLFSRTNPPQHNDESYDREVVEKKKEIQNNINRTHEVQQDSRLNVLNREVNERITEIKKANERHVILQAQMKSHAKQTNLAQQRGRQLQEIKRQQREDIESIKDTYKSNTTKRVNDLIENLRKRRQQIKTKTYAPTSAVRDSININQSTHQPPQFMPQRPEQNMEQKRPMAMRAKIEERLDNVKRDDRKNENNFVQLQKKMFPEPKLPSGSYGKKISFDDIVSMYREKESSEALQCIQKYDMLKNAPVRAQLVKRAYSVTSHLDCFLQFLRFLLDCDPSWKESVEEKSIPIATQMMKMEPKQKITIKEIIPVQLFIKVTKLAAKDYYPIVFDMFKNSLKKIFEKDLMPVHAVGILFRYSLGSQNKFYSKVFYEYYTVILKNYQMRNYDEKELTLLAQKVRSNYSSLPDSKDHALEELFSKITHPGKKTRLLECIQKVIGRKGESLVGGQANKEIAYIVQKLLKN